jgi:protein-tyrosine phosphatase
MNHYWIEERDLRLAIMPRPRGGDWLADDIGFLKRSGVQAIVSALTESEVEELLLSEEERCCVQHALRFFWFPIEDRSVPQKGSKFREFLDRLDTELRKGAALAIHCRAGIGRSSLIAACLLTRHGFSADAAMRAIEEARGCPVPDTAEQRSWIEQFT